MGSMEIQSSPLPDQQVRDAFVDADHALCRYLDQAMRLEI